MELKNNNKYLHALFWDFIKRIIKDRISLENLKNKKIVSVISSNIFNTRFV